MFNILNKYDVVVDTAETVTEAHTLIDFLNVDDRQFAPFHCSPVLVSA